VLGRASERERDFPFGVVRQWLEPSLLAASPTGCDALLRGPAALAGPVLSVASQARAPDLQAVSGKPFYLRELGRALAEARLAPTVAHVEQISMVRRKRSRVPSRGLRGPHEPKQR
jgi:hypothetical protein